ncbi:MAG: cell division protein FtsB [Pontibacterium sp.]
MNRWLSFVLILIILLLNYRLWFGDLNPADSRELAQKIEQQTEKNAIAKERNAALDAEVRDLKSGLSAVEERARSELGLVKKGETFFQLIEPNAQDETR